MVLGSNGRLIFAADLKLDRLLLLLGWVLPHG